MLLWIIPEPVCKHAVLFIGSLNTSNILEWEGTWSSSSYPDTTLKFTSGDNGSTGKSPLKLHTCLTSSTKELLIDLTADTNSLFGLKSSKDLWFYDVNIQYQNDFSGGIIVTHEPEAVDYDNVIETQAVGALPASKVLSWPAVACP